MIKAKANLLSILGIVLVLTSFASAYIGEDEAMHGMMGGAYGFMGLFGWVFMILFLVVLVLLIIWLIKQIGKKK